MLDVLDNPSFTNPWALPTMTTQVPQGLIQPVPQPRGARPKEVVPPKSNEGVPSNQTEVSGMTNLIKSCKSAAPSVVTSVRPSVSQVGDTSIVEKRPNVYEHHDRRYTKRNHQQEPTDSPMGATKKVSICSTPEVITEQGTQRDSVPMELTNNTTCNSQSQDLDIIFDGPFLHGNIKRGADCLHGAFPDYYLPVPENIQVS